LEKEHKSSKKLFGWELKNKRAEKVFEGKTLGGSLTNGRLIKEKRNYDASKDFQAQRWYFPALGRRDGVKKPLMPAI